MQPKRIWVYEDDHGRQVKAKFSWVYENNQGTWSRTSDAMNQMLDNHRVGGINSSCYFPDEKSPTYLIRSHLSDGMSGERYFVQYNLKTQKARMLKCVMYCTEEDLAQQMKDGSDMAVRHSWNKLWKSRDLGKKA